MKKLISIFCLITFITACSTIPNPINTNRLAEIESTYGIALTIAVAYRNTRLCKRTEVVTLTNFCAYRSVILKLQDADKKAQIALIAARKIVRENPSDLNALDVLNIAEDAVYTFQEIEKLNGVR